MQRSEGRILTTHAGSLPRPPELVAMFADREQGRPVAPEALAAAIEGATAWVLPKQLDAGIDIPNNGEHPRDAFFLYVRHRMSGFAGLGSRQGLADDQILVAGVIDTTTNYVEHPEVVADRIERIAHALGDPTRVLAGTDCGFDTSAGMGKVAEDVVWAKLAALSAGARIASDRLFGQ